MFLDKQNELSDQQAVTSTAVSTNTIDLSQVRHIGDGAPLSIHVLVEESAAAAGAATVDFQVVSDSDPALGSPAVLISSTPIAKATLVAGYEFYLPLPPGATYERYLGVNYVVATGPLTAGKFTAHVVENAPKHRTYADAITISS